MSTRANLLIYCSNIHQGGAVRVATSLLSELSKMPQWAGSTTVWASSEVARNVVEMGASTQQFADFQTKDAYGIRAVYGSRPNSLRNFDAVFGVFGPIYEPVLGPLKVTGFAQGWIAYPRNSAYSLLSRPDRLRLKAKYQVQRALFATADILIVEHEHVRTALRKQRLLGRKRIEVVPNTLDEFTLDPSRWKPVQLPPKQSQLRLGIVSRNWPHKNLLILPAVQRILRDSYGLKTEFFVTFEDSEYEACPPSFQESVHNAGPLDLAESPNFNIQMDGIIFPSLLESFSATPLEALATRVPLFASDRPFVGDLVDGHANFFNPLDPRDIAQTIASYFERPLADRMRELNAGYAYVTRETSTSYERAVRTMRIIDSALGVDTRRSLGG